MATKSNPPSPFGGLGDPFDMMQKLWGMTGMPNPASLAAVARIPQPLPSMLAPTVDLGELDKRIADLRAVEQWLELNAGMLRTTIQTLEVQRATIATLKGIGGAMLAPMAEAPAPRPTYPPLPPEFAARAPVAADDAAPPRKHSKPRKAEPASPSLTEEALNPSAWWHALQDQFSRIAAAAGEPSTEPKAGRGRKRRSAPTSRS